MVNETMFGLGAAPSAIRELYAYGLARKAQIGDDKVFDFSIGNPSIPSPAAIAESIRSLIELPPEQLHGYTPAQGTPSCRARVARNLNERFGTSYGMDDLYMTMGAAASICCCLRALLVQGDEVIVIAPFFPEYRMWIENMGATCVQVPARESDFQIDAAAVAAAITPSTRAIIINSPNNPVGAVYSAANLQELASVLEEKRALTGAPIYVVSDEPYRELVYGDSPAPWVPDFIPDTVVCYSWSKSFSLPGERIGYVLVPPTATDARRVYTAVCGAGRALGYVNAPSLFQAVIEQCIDEPADIQAYAHNRELLCAILDEFGYTYIEPQGAFYLWIKALEPDAQAFAEVAKKHELLLVPSDSFGVNGWVRAGYCVSQDTIVRSRDAFAAVMAEYR